MKIIKKGKIPPPRIYLYECDYCGTIFECNEEENKNFKNCPVCHKLVIHAQNSYPVNPIKKVWGFR